MDLSVFSTAPVISVILILFVVGALAGYILGSKLESDKKESALKAAAEEKDGAIARLVSGHEEKFQTLSKAASSDQEKLREAYQEESRRLTEEHGKLITQLNDTNLSNTKALQQDHETHVARLNKENSDAAESAKREYAKEIQTIKSEAENTLEKFRAEHAKAVSLVQEENQKTVQLLERKHQAQVDLMETENRAEKGKLTNRITELEQERTKLADSIAQLEEKIKEDRKNNTFSMSKSGDRLMSVVRSVQELANELEATSKTVTAGEYSVFNELRDNRKQEKILSLGESEEGEESGEIAGDEELVDEGEPVESEAQEEEKS